MQGRKGGGGGGGFFIFLSPLGDRRVLGGGDQGESVASSKSSLSVGCGGFSWVLDGGIHSSGDQFLEEDLR